jgi:hypothetical protein
VEAHHGSGIAQAVAGSQRWRKQGKVRKISQADGQPPR